MTDTAEFLSAIFADQPGLIQIGTDQNRRGDFFPTTAAGIDRAATYAAQLDRARPRGVYFRVTTLAERPASPHRGGAADTLGVPILWADLDIGSEGHAPASDGRPNPPTEGDAFGLIAEAGLPEPTVLVHSGGGLYPLWRVEGWADLEQAAAVAKAVQAHLGQAAEAHGWSYGQGVGDLARVLRLPGSMNRKTGNSRPCRVIAMSDRRYAPAEFPAPPARAELRNSQLPRGDRTGEPRGTGPLDALDLADWAELLEPEGWEFVATERGGDQLWMRPGGASSKYSMRIFADRPVAWCWSEAAGLPTDRALNKAQLWAELHHGGDLSAAAQDLIAAGRGDEDAGAALSLPAAVLDAVQATCPAEATNDAAPYWCRPMTSRGLRGLIVTVLAADESDRPRMLRWATRKLGQQVRAGHLTDPVARGVITGVKAKLTERSATR